MPGLAGREAIVRASATRDKRPGAHRSDLVFNPFPRLRGKGQEIVECDGVARFLARGSRRGYSPSVSSEALPPAAVVLTVNVRSVTKRSR